MLLNKLRQSAKGGLGKFMIYGLISVAVGGMVFMDVGGFFRGGVHRNSAARVGGTQISASALDTTVRRALYAQNIDAATAYKLGLIDRIMGSMISGELMHQATYDLGLQAGDDAVAARIGKLVEPMVRDGMSKKDVLNRLLLSQGMSESQFLAEVRRDMAANILRGALQSATAFTPPQEARDIYQYQNESRTIKAVILPNSGITDYKEPDDKVLLPFYEAGQERYAIPETRNFSMIVLTEDALKKTLDVSDEELQKIYDDNIDAYRQPERRTLEQSVFADEAAAKKAADLLAAGKSLKDAAKESSGSETAYLGSGTFEKDGLAKEMADAVFAADRDKTVGPVKTALGWHILIVKDILPPTTQSFADAKAKIKKETLHNKLADQLYEASAQIDDMLAGGTSMEDVAKNMDLKAMTFGPVREDGSAPGDKEGLKGFDKDRGDIMKTVFDLTEGESAPVMELDGGGYAAIRIDTVTPKSYRPFDAVKKELAKIWVEDQQSVMNKQRASDALRSLASGEKTLQQVASAYGAAIQTYTLKRNEDPPKPLSTPAKTKFFETPDGEYTVSNAYNGYIVGQIAGVTLPDTGKIPEKELAKTIETATQGTQDEFLMAWLRSLYDRASVKINHALIQQMYGPGNEGG